MTRRGEAGFTLLELLITMAVTIVGLMGLMALHLTTTRGNDLASRSAEGVTVAQRTLEDLRSLPVKDMFGELTGDRNAPTPIDVTMDTVSGRSGMTYRRRVFVDEMAAASPDILRLRVEVNWTDDNIPNNTDQTREHTIALEILRTRQEAL